MSTTLFSGVEQRCIRPPIYEKHPVSKAPAPVYIFIALDLCLPLAYFSLGHGAEHRAKPQILCPLHILRYTGFLAHFNTAPLPLPVSKPISSP
ncbi:hypothetical protein K505DRAFT_68660 [Melanomma pulvis-pyrius CBS 109.77]|uniref:Uncharacterized protein n=1 Tax=Melanomma pulvis-pyrius CBS 109.77 TaxID=1314802 RepID=A0A6A6X4L9_9PLEO|nr:hypothetical protein K505DRAFT_68660 [Melanomma pulvis-pyrius CBS 109.77]